MNVRVGFVVSLLLVSVGLAGTASATIISSSSFGTIQTDPDRTGMASVQPTDNPLLQYVHEAPDGIIHFNDVAGDGLTMRNPDGTSPSWWNSVGPVFTTGSNTITISFEGMNVFGFAFNLGANMPATAWIRAFFEDDTGAAGSLYAGNLAVGGGSPARTPGFGVFAAGGSSCARITSIVIDPEPFEWGVGNMAIDSGSCGSVSVPEPGSLALLGAGLLGLSMLRRKRGELKGLRG